ncbi:MAG: helix-turn-helix transcriptional regulator [Lachnospiraceae bacterium]|nr:helix-turn-helix transcriptional regulator [Lachnospiraceae bacterium]
MMLSEKLYQLRKKSGLSQEQLAEQLNVSRQAISKWESGSAFPESEKLIIISNYLGVSVDCLLKDDVEDDAKTENSEVGKNPKMLAGLIICIAGMVSMVLWGLFSILRPEASTQMSESSMITIDGNGIFLILCVLAVIAGAGLLLKSQKK